MGLIRTPFSSKARLRVWKKSDEKLSSSFFLTIKFAVTNAYVLYLYGCSLTPSLNPFLRISRIYFRICRGKNEQQQQQVSRGRAQGVFAAAACVQT